MQFKQNKSNFLLDIAHDVMSTAAKRKVIYLKYLDKDETSEAAKKKKKERIFSAFTPSFFIFPRLGTTHKHTHCKFKSTLRRFL